LEEIPDLDIICAPVSGGGLLSGTAIAAKSLRPEIVVIGCEPANADDAYRSMASGRLEPASNRVTMADGLRAILSPRTFAILRERVTGILCVSEEEIVSATRVIWERMKIIVEPSSAVAIAPLLKPGAVASLGLPIRNDGRTPKLGVILSGGNVDFSALPF
jgi:threonine dehydratase